MKLIEGAIYSVTKEIADGHLKQNCAQRTTINRNGNPVQMGEVDCTLHKLSLHTLRHHLIPSFAITRRRYLPNGVKIALKKYEAYYDYDYYVIFNLPQTMDQAYFERKFKKREQGKERVILPIDHIVPIKAVYYVMCDKFYEALNKVNESFARRGIGLHFYKINGAGDHNTGYYYIIGVKELNFVETKRNHSKAYSSRSQTNHKKRRRKSKKHLKRQKRKNVRMKKHARPC